MGDWNCKIVFIASHTDWTEAERIVSGYLDDGWELLAVTQSPGGSGERIWLRRRRGK